MFEEEERPRRPARFTPAVLDRWDAEELRDYVAALREEIARAEAVLAKGAAQRAAADAFFKRPPGNG